MLYSSNQNSRKKVKQFRAIYSSHINDFTFFQPFPRIAKYKIEILNGDGVLHVQKPDSNRSRHNDTRLGLSNQYSSRRGTMAVSITSRYHSSSLASLSRGSQKKLCPMQKPRPR